MATTMFHYKHTREWADPSEEQAAEAYEWLRQEINLELRQVVVEHYMTQEQTCLATKGSEAGQ